MNIKVLIVDDQSGMRLLLRKIIEKTKKFEVIGEAANGEEALEKYMELSPDVVFLDVEMPEVTGIELAKTLFEINSQLKIIFATAYADYMDSAFEVYAYDYLLKPFRVERVFKTLTRLSKEFEKKDLIKDKNSDRIIIKGKERSIFVDKNSLILIQREDGGSVLYTEFDKIKTTMKLSELEEKLGSEKFFRSHKSYIINKNKINSIHSYGRWTYLVKLEKINEDALMTQKKYEELKSEF